VESGSATIATVERAADILMHFATTAQNDFGVTEISEDLGLSKAAVHRVLASLRSRGLVELDERTRRYSLGVSAMKLGLTYLDRIDVRRVALPYLQELTARTAETATLSVRVGDRSRIYVDQITPEREVIMSVMLGEPYPLHAGASSRALLAFLPQEKIEAYIASRPLESMTAR
jgi:DNA-binding IclR family transcriptional regulator